MLEAGFGFKDCLIMTHAKQRHLSLVIGVGILTALSACAPSGPSVTLSEEARAAIPAGTDLSTIAKRADGCYFIVDKRGLSGFTQPLRDTSGIPICDPVPFEDFLSPNRVVVNETVI